MQCLGRILMAVTLAVGMSVAATPVLAMASDSSAVGQSDTYQMGSKAIQAKDWAGAIEAFTKVVESDSDNADAWNYLGFANRKLGNYEVAFQHYARALEIDPKHKGAHEYLGEAYLLVGNLAKAEEHLAKLDDICLFGCNEYSALKKAVAEYKKKRSSS